MNTIQTLFLHSFSSPSTNFQFVWAMTEGDRLDSFGWRMVVPRFRASWMYFCQQKRLQSENSRQLNHLSSLLVSYHMAQVIPEKQRKENYRGQPQGYSPHKSKHIPRPQPPISDRAWRIARASSSQETAGAAAPKTNTLHAESGREWERDGGGRKQKGCPEVWGRMRRRDRECG